MSDLAFLLIGFLSGWLVCFGLQKLQCIAADPALPQGVLRKMDLYNTHCPACGVSYIMIQDAYDEVKNVVHRKCRRCGYRWDELPGNARGR